MIENEKFWETMFEELDKTSQEDWEQFVKEHNMGGRKMKQYYSVENFNINNYGKEGLLIQTKLNKCAINNLVVYFEKYYLAHKCIEHIEFNSNPIANLKLYVSYKEDNKQRYEIVQVIAEDFNELKNEWLNFICDIFSEVFLSKEEEGPYGTYC